MSTDPDKDSKSAPISEPAPAAESAAEPAAPVDPVAVFTREWADALFPPERTEKFFNALYGKAEEGAYTIALRFVRAVEGSYEFAFDLHQRPGKCLVCSLTHGLPQVFSRHPVINLRGVAHAVAAALGKEPETALWKLKPTQETSTALHSVPLIISFTA